MNPIWRKDLSAIAWDGDQCVGMVLGLVSEEENLKKGQNRIWTESICVRHSLRSWSCSGEGLPLSICIWYVPSAFSASMLWAVTEFRLI